jgi:hypothetical protein
MSLAKLNELELNLVKAKYPNNPYPVATVHKDTDTNSLTRAVKRCLELHEAQCERVANKGTYIPGKVVSKGFYGATQTKGKFIPGQGRNGTSDLHSTIPVVINGNKLGLSVKWEIKCLATKDKIRPNQIDYTKEVEQAGGLVYFVRTFDEFVAQYKSLMVKYSQSDVMLWEGIKG